MGQRNRITASRRIFERHCYDRIYFAAIDLQSAEIVRNPDLLAEIEHGVEEPVKATVNTEIAGEALAPGERRLQTLDQ